MRLFKRAILVGLAAVILATGVALATPGVGAVGEVLARGTLSDTYGAKMKVIVGLINSGLFRSTDIAVQKVTIAPGGHTGWHTHPGPAVVVVKTGTLTFYDAHDPRCRPIQYPAGTAFVDQGVGHVHIARNEGSTPVELWVTYFVPGAAGGSFRNDAADPGHCPF
jgi:quercetin dioxygenase-like cupin family protein